MLSSIRGSVTVIAGAVEALETGWQTNPQGFDASTPLPKSVRQVTSAVSPSTVTSGWRNHCSGESPLLLSQAANASAEKQ